MSKVKIVQEIAGELPVSPVISYLLCDSWYTCGSMDAFVKKLFYTIGALKTNRVLYPCGISRRSLKGNPEVLLLMSLAHLIACTGCGGPMSFEDGHIYIYSHIPLSTSVGLGVSFLRKS